LPLSKRDVLWSTNKLASAVTEAGTTKSLIGALTRFLRVFPECRNHAHVLKHPSTRKCPLTGDVIRSFNRDTAWLATGVLGALVLAALMLAVEERQSKATQAERNLLPNSNSATVESVVAKSSNSNGKMTFAPGSSIDPTFTEPPRQEIPSSEVEPAATSPISAPAFTLQKNRDAPRQDSTQAPAPKIRSVRNRSSLASRFIGVKRRLIELWHQSMGSETRSWTAFSKLNSGVKKKTAYTAATRD
jgi:hypothetical protein